MEDCLSLRHDRLVLDAVSLLSLETEAICQKKAYESQGTADCLCTYELERLDGLLCAED
jgi:hypothetical protein